MTRALPSSGWILRGEAARSYRIIFHRFIISPPRFETEELLTRQRCGDGVNCSVIKTIRRTEASRLATLLQRPRRFPSLANTILLLYHCPVRARNGSDERMNILDTKPSPLSFWKATKLVKISIRILFFYNGSELKTQNSHPGWINHRYPRLLARF